MKKIIIYFILFILIIFLMPAIFTKKTMKTSYKQEEKQQIEENIEKKEEEKYQYNKFENIKLLHTKTAEVENIKIDKYICNVVSAEMPADFDIKALEAQSIVARTYTIYKILNKKHNNADICDDSSCCQAWISKDERLSKWEEDKRESNWNKICEAVSNTSGKIVTYNNEPINAFFHSNSGGKTEIPVNVWGGNGYPYLQSVETSGEEGYVQYSSKNHFTQEELINKIKEEYADIKIDFTDNEQIKILEFTESGRVRKIRFGNHEISGVEARKIFGLKSTNFEVENDKNEIKFVVKGYGHGVGMSQTGADAMAKQGNNAEDIIKHFYSNIEIKDINSL